MWVKCFLLVSSIAISLLHVHPSYITLPRPKLVCCGRALSEPRGMTQQESTTFRRTMVNSYRTKLRLSKATHNTFMFMTAHPPPQSRLLLSKQKSVCSKGMDSLLISLRQDEACFERYDFLLFNI